MECLRCQRPASEYCECECGEPVCLCGECADLYDTYYCPEPPEGEQLSCDSCGERVA